MLKINNNFILLKMSLAMRRKKIKREKRNRSGKQQNKPLTHVVPLHAEYFSAFCFYIKLISVIGINHTISLREFLNMVLYLSKYFFFNFDKNKTLLRINRNRDINTYIYDEQ